MAHKRNKWDGSGFNIFTPFEGSSGSYFERPQHVDILKVGTREHTLILSSAQYVGTFDTL